MKDMLRYPNERNDPAVPNAKVSQADLDLEFERTITSAEEEFIQSGPIHLLEAVYCDPCKAKVMDLCKIYVHA